MNIIFVSDNRSVVEKGMIESIRKQQTELHNSTRFCKAPAMLQAVADKA